MMRTLLLVLTLNFLLAPLRALPEPVKSGQWKGQSGTYKTRFFQPNLHSQEKAEKSSLIVYLKGLASERMGTELDEVLLDEFLKAGFVVLELDFAGDPKARMPWINRELGLIRDQIRAGSLVPGWKFDNARCYLVPAGHRLKTNIVYYRDGRTLAADLIYPAKASKPVGTVLEFSCDNQDRMGNTSLSICSDTLLDAFACEGLAVAMVDHPVAAPYKGMDPMPDCGRKVRAAVRVLRREAVSLGLSGKMLPVGFSRGSGMALLLLSTDGHRKFDGFGEVPEGDASVQGAVIMSGRFTYLDLLPNDKMIPRYEAVWGKRDQHEEIWRAHGALDYLEKPSLPVFLTINCTEGREALHQMEVLQKRLKQLGSAFEYHLDTEPRGHKVTLDAEILGAMRAYVLKQLE